MLRGQPIKQIKKPNSKVVRCKKQLMNNIVNADLFLAVDCL